ncbi:MAG: group II intron reverse transcriptase/maturase [Elusimicrobia bacterium]|nr:group II intron reverse transcriptase/maturase [Elusimicrobiota bacterium]MBD3412682.1 group II intron reverse transcriptase/maturase [Elusimicrobiota bacterium]
MMKQGNNDGTPMPVSLSTKLNRLSEMAKQFPQLRFRTLAHLINEESLTKAFHELNNDAAAGVDSVTAQEYRNGLPENLKDLHQRLRERRYRAQPLKRVYIDKADGRKRPLAIPVLEDKIVQKAVINTLNPIYEQDFLPCSYGYRPNRNAHQAVQALQKAITLGKVSYVLEADIERYFDLIVLRHLRDFLQKRIADKDILRIIGKWLHVGVIDDDRLLRTQQGVYQGSVISPLLANIYLHEVLDYWFKHTVKPRMRGEVTLIRYADDFVICFQYRSDAQFMQKALPIRFEEFGLKLNLKKTRLISFGRFEKENSEKQNRKPNTFNFLGFTFYCSTSRKGIFTVKSKTMSTRLHRALSTIGIWCRKNRHLSLYAQWRHLVAVLTGHYNYYGIRANYRSLKKFFQGV